MLINADEEPYGRGLYVHDRFRFALQAMLTFNVQRTVVVVFLAKCVTAFFFLPS